MLSWLSWLKWISIFKYGLDVRKQAKQEWGVIAVQLTSVVFNLISLSEMKMFFSLTFVSLRLHSSMNWKDSCSTATAPCEYGSIAAFDHSIPLPPHPQQKEAHLSSLSCRLPGELFLSSRGIDYSVWGFWQNHVALLVIITVCMFLAYVQLRRINRWKWSLLSINHKLSLTRLISGKRRLLSSYCFLSAQNHTSFQKGIL